MALTGIIQNDLPLPENRKPKKQAGLGRVGFIKVGEKRKGKNGKEYPVSLDYFRCHADKAYQEQFTQALGEKPNRIQISFLSNDPAHACNARYELRDKCGKLYCQSDGQTFKVSAGEQWTMISLPEILNKYETLENFMEKDRKSVV